MNLTEPLRTVTQGRSGDPGARIAEIRTFLQERLIGADALVERLLIGLLADGHVLLEGAPGLAKTRAVKLLASASNLSFARIQCTPDLMPADITGTSIWRQDKGVFEFAAGPIFHSLLLVDEINRAPPKVQSALLEAMAERQATIAGATHALPDPFMTVATQNPIEHEGTFPLPEAQLDRFMLHVELALPNATTERLILDLVESEQGEPVAPPAALEVEEIAAARHAAKSVFLSAAIKDYIVRLVTAPRDASTAPELAAKIEHPASPRGTLALAAAAKARAFLDGRDYAAPQDVSELAVDVLSHRTILGWRALAEGETPRAIIRAYLDAVPPA
ncbi:AAA family ATPase [Methylosinus sp. H3A]|uniref:AAA family ATPase n=1 Tax=Methylosinus sp. H3A TaxID=2785786 RepID=UPI0018C280F6|nr:AAA family ATPase [Methylosinus sp. H3A]MBG0810543.1 AAA family ATPase [Methylosinus sp. H3A]